MGVASAAWIPDAAEPAQHGPLPSSVVTPPPGDSQPARDHFPSIGLVSHDDRVSNRSGRVPARIVRASEGEPIPAAGVEHLFKLTGEHTGGRLGFERFVVPPTTLGARPHIHWAHDEYFYVVDGELTVATENGEVLLLPGDVAHAERGSVHGFRNAHAETATMALCMYTPPGYEQYFRDVHAAVASGTELTVDLLRELRAEHQTDSL